MRGRLLGPFAVLAALAVLLVAPRAAGVELEGTWHVLVHYRDTASPRPALKRWEDRVWVFEREEGRLRWSEYPIVVFDDQEGRFEARGSSRAQRVLGFWAPNEAQRAQIRAGLQVNSRGAREKTLRGSAESGWSSGGGGGYRSARFLTYEASWSIEGLPEAPVFRQEEVLGGAAAESLEGRTVYTTLRVEEEGELLRGRYLRDGRRVGTFRMRRAGAVRGLEEREEEDAAERVRERLYRTIGEQLLRDGLPEVGTERPLREAIEADALGPAERERLRAAIRADLSEGYRSQGNDPREHQAAIETLAREIERLLVEGGESLEAIRARLRRGELRP